MSTRSLNKSLSGNGGVQKPPLPLFTNHRLNAVQQHQVDQKERERKLQNRTSDSIPDHGVSCSTSADDDCYDEDESSALMSSSCASESSFESLRTGRGKKQQAKRVSSIRESWQRKSEFSKLSHETQQFQKIVADLETLLKNSGESPESAWKARILVHTTQETDQVLQAKLQEYEHNLLTSDDYRNKNSSERRTAQMACHKLNRDFQRSHKALVLCLSLYEQRQQAEISQLGAARHEGPEEPDFFDRAVRQKELELMNQKMHQVNNIYQDLAGLVERQQEPIDQLQDNTDFAAQNVDAAANNLRCYADRREMKEMLMCGAMEMPSSSFEPCGAASNKNNNGSSTTVDKTVSFSDDKPHGIRVTESFRWSMPFETLREDLQSVRNDLVDVGKGIVSHGKQSLQCGAPAEAAVL